MLTFILNIRLSTVSQAQRIPDMVLLLRQNMKSHQITRFDFVELAEWPHGPFRQGEKQNASTPTGLPFGRASVVSAA
jgi:hypothetical protein